MNYRRAFSLFAIALPIASSALFSQTLTQEEFLRQLIRAHPLFEKERLTPRIEQEAQSAFLGAEDWNLFSSVNLSHEEPALAFSGPEKTNALFLDAGVEKAIWSTGGRLGASISSGSARILPTFGFSMPLYQNQITLSYVHPLLKNRGGFLDRLPFDLKQFDVDLSNVQAVENMEDFLKQSANLFLNWVFLTEQESIIAERLKLSEEERDRTQEKRKANLVDQADVIRSEDAVRLWKQNQVLIESQRKAVQGELAVLTGNGDIRDLKPAFELYRVETLSPIDETVRKLKEQSRILKVLHVRRNQLGVARSGYEETSKPDLSVVAEFNTKRLDQRFSTSLEMDKPDARIGLRFSLPIGNTTATSQIAKTDLQINQLDRHVEETTLLLASTVTNLHIRMKELETVLTLNREQIESARARTNEELKLYNQGRGDLTFVLLSRDNEQNAKLTYAQNAYSYHILRLEYHALMDELYTPEGE